MSWKSKLANWLSPPQSQRDYSSVTSSTGGNAGWITSGVTEDADLWMHNAILRNRSRDEFKLNPYFQKYREQLFANVFGAEGIYLRMKVKETEDRVIHTPEEKAVRLEWMRRRQRVAQWVSERETGMPAKQAKRWSEHYARHIEILESPTRQATIKVGEPDLFANKVIEDGKKRWRKAENCDVRGVLEYTLMCNLRLVSAARDGGIFIRMVKDGSVNKFGFALQLINDEWCDHSYNETLPNGNVVRMGIEYPMSNWGIGKPVKYHMIKRQATDWQYNYSGGMFGRGRKLEHDAIDASEIIHYTRRTDADGTRPAPWSAPVLQNGRHLTKAEEAEVIASRVAACKMGWFWSDLVADPGSLVSTIDPRDCAKQFQNAIPGAFGGLPFGVKFADYDPKHPNGNFPLLQKAILRSWCAGMPGANYNSIGNDLEGISFSAGRLGHLDVNELFMILQHFDIVTAEEKINDNWLMMALITGQVPLPVARFEKFNKPIFQGRRWHGIDEVKEATSAAMRIANKTSSRTMECAANSTDFEEIAFELAEEKMLLEGLGLDDSTAKSDATGAMADKPAEQLDAEDDAEIERSRNGGSPPRILSEEGEEWKLQ